MALPACAWCGKTNPRRMFGLMTLWFGPFVEMRPDHGYFHLCPACYRTFVQPHLEQVRNRLAELHPLARQLGLPVDRTPEDDDGDVVEPDAKTAVAASTGDAGA